MKLALLLLLVSQADSTAEERFADQLDSLTRGTRAETEKLRASLREMNATRQPAQVARLSPENAKALSDSLVDVLRADKQRVQETHDGTGKVLARYREKIPNPGPILMQAIQTFFEARFEFEQVQTEAMESDTAFLNALVARYSEPEPKPTTPAGQP